MVTSLMAHGDFLLPDFLAELPIRDVDASGRVRHPLLKYPAHMVMSTEQWPIFPWVEK